MRLTAIITFLIFSISCKTSQSQITFNSVESGNNLEQIALIPFDDFFEIWILNRRIQKLNLNAHKLYEDSICTYFGMYKIGVLNSTPQFFKVYSDTLNDTFPNYTGFYGDELSGYLWQNIIPKEDENLWRNSECSKNKNKPNSQYELLGKKVIITMTWKLEECDDLLILKGKKYQAIYNLITNQYEK